MKPIDRTGRTVSAGTRVRVLKICEALKQSLPAEEWAELQTMVGEVFEVYEIDEYGSPWVEKRFGGNHSHHLALAPDEMEIVE